MNISKKIILEISTIVFIFSNIIDYTGSIGLKYFSFVLIIFSMILFYEKIKIRNNLFYLFLLLIFFFSFSIIITEINGGNILTAFSYNSFFITTIIILVFVDLIDKKIFSYHNEFFILFLFIILIGNFFSNIYPVDSISNLIQYFASDFDKYEGIRSSSMIIVPKVYFQFTLYLPAAYIYFLYNGKNIKSILILISVFLSLSRSAIIVCLVFSLINFFRFGGLYITIKRIIYLTVFIIIIINIIETFIPNTIIHLTNLLDNRTFSTGVRIGQISDLNRIFMNNPFYIFFGMGSGTPIFSNFLLENVYNLEIGPLDLFRKYGIFFIATLFYLLFRLFYINFSTRKEISYALLTLIILNFTNPILTAPIYIFIFSLTKNPKELV